MDWEHIKQNGYSAWQVIPLFFGSYIGFALLLGGGAELAFHSYDVNIAINETNHRIQLAQAWALLISGICVLSLALVYSIVVCLIVPILNKRRQRGTLQAPQTEAFSVEEGVLHTWYASSQSDTNIQEAQDIMDSSQAVLYRYRNSKVL